MSSDVDSTDRSTGEFITFAISFLAFMLVVAGIVVTRPIVVVLGFVILLFSILSYGFSSNGNR